MAIVRIVSSWEASAKLSMILNSTYSTRDTGTVSPRGGSASIKIVETTNNVDAFAYLATGSQSPTNEDVDTYFPTAAGTQQFALTAPGAAWGFDWYTGSTPTGGDGNICMMYFDSSGASTPFDLNLMWRKSDGKIELFKQATAGTHAAGTSQATGSKVYAQNTWYRIWIWVDPSAAGGTGTFKVSVWVGEIDAQFYTKDIDASVTNTSTARWLPYLGGHLDATTAPGWTTYFDNVFAHSHNADGEFHDYVITLSSTSGEGTTTNWTPSTGTTHYTLVDELPENGSGTTDSDYVGETVTDDELFDQTVTYPAAKYANPRAIIQSYWHRNASAAKWATAGNRLLCVSQATTQGVGGVFDPGSSYGGAGVLRRRGLDAGRIVPADLVGMEFGMRHGSGGTPDWRVSAVAGEVVHSRIAAVAAFSM